MGILEKNIELMKNILNKEMGIDVSPKHLENSVLFEINEAGLSDGEIVSFIIHVSKMHISIRTILDPVDRNNIIEVEEYIAKFNMQSNIVKCGVTNEGICVRTGAFVYPDNKREEERLTRVLKAHLNELSGIIKNTAGFIKSEAEEEKAPKKPKMPKKPKFDFSLFD